MSLIDSRCRKWVPRVTALTLLIALTAPVFGQDRAVPRQWQKSVVIRWNEALLEAVRRTGFRPMWTARALAIVHTAMFDAWAPFDPVARGLYWDRDLRFPIQGAERSSPDRRAAEVEAAVSMAAYRTLVDLFPSETDRLFRPLLIELGLSPDNRSEDTRTGVGLGNRCASLVLNARHGDGSNQLGERGGGAYGDYTGYRPLNTPERVVDPNRWQPLRGADGTAQSFLAPHWGLVQPFAMVTGAQFRPGPPPLYPDARFAFEADAVRRLSAGLTDRDKAIAEYWADGPNTETPPGHWNLFAQYVSVRDRQSLGQDVVMFFALGNALLDASIAVWDAKVAYDFARPISAIRFLNAGQVIEAWGGPGNGRRLISGETFRSYIATPAFAEYTSGHSAFSAAAAMILTEFTRSPTFGASTTIRAGSSTVEPGLTPATDVTLRWSTFQEAADEAGFSRRLGGIHFESGDLASRKMGAEIAQLVWRKVEQLLDGSGDTARPR